MAFNALIFENLFPLGNGSCISRKWISQTFKFSRRINMGVGHGLFFFTVIYFFLAAALPALPGLSRKVSPTYFTPFPL